MIYYCVHRKTHSEPDVSVGWYRTKEEAWLDVAVFARHDPGNDRSTVTPVDVPMTEDGVLAALRQHARYSMHVEEGRAA
jgi:hypothetical protein